MKDLIEKLKENKIAWMFLSKEEQECLRQANKNAGVDNLKYDGRWENPGEPWADISGGENSLWRIKPDYQPEPEFVDLEIKLEGGFLGAKVEGNWFDEFPYSFTHLHCLPSLPNFEEFGYQDNPGCKITNLKLSTIAKYVREGKKVFATFKR